jgi:phosphoglycerate dehydrogenase-like enzyme
VGGYPPDGMMGRMTDPLVWLPFDPSELGDVPEGLRYQVVDGDPLPDEGRDEVEFFVMPYRFAKADAEAIGTMGNLRVVQTMTAGVEHVRPYVPEGVLLCNGRGIHDTSTAELAVALTLASLRGLPDHVRSQDLGTWKGRWGQSLADKRVLIVGYGQIGEAIERRVLPFEAEVVRVARSARDGVHPIDELPAMLPEADVVVLIVPGTSETAGLFDAEMLARMKDGALLVNVSRGGVVVTDALVAELQSQRLHAALDVVDPEPLPEGHPLWTCPNLLLTPHVGGASSAMWPRAHRLVREQLERFARGEEPANVMTGDY